VAEGGFAFGLATAAAMLFIYVLLAGSFVQIVDVNSILLCFSSVTAQVLVLSMRFATCSA
jgi:hypothetical protein